MVKFDHIRNFAIIAHIDHGKSTLADRLIQECDGLSQRELTAQVLDNMDIEKERGITIKAQTVRLMYQSPRDNKTYMLNIVDTPGHVDFAYEVSRSLAACEGSILVVDASQGVEAQTLANVYQAIDNNHDIIPILNKIDLPAAEPDRVKTQIQEVIGLDTSHSVEVSAKTGQGIQEVLQNIVDYLPAPTGDLDAPLKAMLVDSWYDQYLGVIILVRLIDGKLKRGMKIKMMAADSSYQIDQVGYFTPKKILINELNAGEIGFITAGIKHVAHCKVGDTITDDAKPTPNPLTGFKPSTPVVFCGLFPIDAGQYEHLKDSLEKLHLNDASFHYETEKSAALGFGFRCGFLGMLHLEIIQERLEREFDVDLVTTAPSVIYKIFMKNGHAMELHNPADLPDIVKIDHIQEPWIKTTIMVPDEFLGATLTLCTERRGRQLELTYAGTRAMAVYLLPLSEIVFDFYDRLKSISRGYASCDYEFHSYERADLHRVHIMVNGENVDALAFMCHKTMADKRGRSLCAKLKDLIPKHLFKIPIQAAIGGKIIARETISAMRKDVTAKCYGGDVTRKRKLLEKQKKGKAKMRQFGRVDIPQSAFLAALKMDD